MDPEQTFMRVQGRFSQILTPRVRVALEYIYLFIAITFFCILVTMHANYVQQLYKWERDGQHPGCSSELSGIDSNEVQLIQIKITSAGLWSRNESETVTVDNTDLKTATENVEVASVVDEGLMFLDAKFWLNWFDSGARKGKSAWKFWNTDGDLIKQHAESSTNAKQTFKVAVVHFGKKWYRRLSFIWRHAVQIFASFHKLLNITGLHLNLDVPKWLRILHFDKLNSYAVHWLERRSKAFEPTYLYSLEKGYFLLPEAAKSQHNIRTVNISLSARHPCFGNRWQQLLINRFVGYDTIMMNSLLHKPGLGYLYNFQTKEFYNLSYAQELPGSSARLGDYLVTKCGVLMMSLFVFFTTTMSVSFTLRETQTRMLKFTVQLQHHARHRLPTFQLIFVHVIESLVFVPIMIGILFFLFEFYDDQLLAFMVLILVWICELFILISVRTPISMKFFPRFFSLYFLVFHIYFFSYAYGFSYLALSTAAAFMQHLILYFWNRFEVPAVQRFMQSRRSQLQQHPDFHITSSTILASTLHIRRLNTRNPGLANTDPSSGLGSRTISDQAMPANVAGEAAGPQGNTGNNNVGQIVDSVQIPGQGQPELPQAEAGSNPGTTSSFSSLLLWILGGAS
ncbi:membralin-like protein At1g60995 isoform X3 [Gossypium arboreum]|uniref:membralin-like protein At1g60995 isoform X3 n=1 Tax=Gossypium arboreum TaxID=29729 RepID=UPI0022F1D95F|nr:membralin-like protein At1g60995 isoform X3 [Gossypium arboreum]